MLGADKFKKAYLGHMKSCSQCGDKNLRYLGFATWLCGNGHTVFAFKDPSNPQQPYLITNNYGIEKADETYSIDFPPLLGDFFQYNAVHNPPAWDKDGCLCQGQTCKLPQQIEVNFDNFLGVAGGGDAGRKYRSSTGNVMYGEPIVGNFLKKFNICEVGSNRNYPLSVAFGSYMQYSSLCEGSEGIVVSGDVGAWSMGCGCWDANGSCYKCSPGEDPSVTFTDKCGFNNEVFWVPTDYNNQHNAYGDRCDDTYLIPEADCSTNSIHSYQKCATIIPDCGVFPLGPGCPSTWPADQWVPGGYNGELEAKGCYDLVTRRRCHECGTFRCSGEDAKYRIECSPPNNVFTYTLSSMLNLNQLNEQKAFLPSNGVAIVSIYTGGGGGQLCAANDGGHDGPPTNAHFFVEGTLERQCPETFPDSAFALWNLRDNCENETSDLEVIGLPGYHYDNNFWSRTIEQPKGLRSALLPGGDVSVEDINNQTIILDRIPSNMGISWNYNERKAEPGIANQAYIEYPNTPNIGSDTEPELIAVIISESGIGGQVAFQTWPVTFDSDILINNDTNPDDPRNVLACRGKTRMKEHGYGVMYPFFDDPIWQNESGYNFPVFLRGNNYKIGDKIEFRAWRAMDNVSVRQSAYEDSIGIEIEDISPGENDPAWEETVREVIVATATITEVDARGGILWYEFDGDPISGDCPCERDWPGDPGDADLNIQLFPSCASISNYCYPEDHAKIDYINCGFYASQFTSCEYDQELKGPNECNILYQPIVGTTNCYPNKSIVELSDSGIYRLSSCSEITSPAIPGYWDGSFDVPTKAAKFKYEWIPNPICYWNVSEGSAVNYLLDRGCSPLFQFYADNNGDLQIRKKFKDYEISSKSPCRKSDDGQGNTLFVKYEGGEGVIVSGVLGSACCYVIFDDIQDAQQCPNSGVFIKVENDNQCTCCPEGYTGVFPPESPKAGRCCIDCSETSEEEGVDPATVLCEANCWEALLELPECKMENGRPVCKKYFEKNNPEDDCEQNPEILNWINELRTLCGDYIIGSYQILDSLCPVESAPRTNDDYCRVYGFYQQKQNPCHVTYEGQYIMRAQKSVGVCEPVIENLTIDFIRLESKIDITIAAPMIQDYILPERLPVPENGKASSAWNNGFSQGGFNLWTALMFNNYPDPRHNCEVNDRKSLLLMETERCSYPTVLDCDEKCVFNPEGSECITLPDACGGFTYCYDCYTEGYREYLDPLNNRISWKNSFRDICGYPWESDCNTAMNEEYQEQKTNCYIENGELICESPTTNDTDIWYIADGFSIQEKEKSKCDPYCMLENKSCIITVKAIDSCVSKYCFAGGASFNSPYPDDRLIGYPERFYDLPAATFGQTQWYTSFISTDLYVNPNSPTGYGLPWDLYPVGCAPISCAGDGACGGVGNKFYAESSPVIIKCYKDDSGVDVDPLLVDQAISDYLNYWSTGLEYPARGFKGVQAIYPSNEYQYDQGLRLLADYIFDSSPYIRRIEIYAYGYCNDAYIFENCAWSKNSNVEPVEEEYSGSIAEIEILNPGSGYAFEIEERYSPTGILEIPHIVFSDVVSKPINIKRKEETWGLESYTLIHEGSGNYDPGDTIPIKFYDDNARRNGIQYIRYPTLIVDSVDDSGIITETSILESGEYYMWKGTGQHRAFPISITLNNYWQHPNSLDASTQLGDGALLRAVVDVDPNSKNYGGVVDVVVEAGGRNYVDKGKYWIINTQTPAGGNLQIDHLVDACKYDMGVKDPLTIWDLPVFRTDPNTGSSYNKWPPNASHYVKTPSMPAFEPVKWRDKVQSWTTILTKEECPLELMNRAYDMSLTETIFMMPADCDSADCDQIEQKYDVRPNHCPYEEMGEIILPSPNGTVTNPQQTPPQNCCALPDDDGSLRWPECNVRTSFMSEAYREKDMIGLRFGRGNKTLNGCKQTGLVTQGQSIRAGVDWSGFQNAADTDVPEYSIIANWNPNNANEDGVPSAYHRIYGFNGSPLRMILSARETGEQ
jgi:hypothetical protein